MNKETFGAFVAQSRKEKGITQQNLADQLHVTDKAVSKWERGICYPDLTLMESLAVALDLTVSELMACQRKTEHTEEDIAVRSLLDISGNVLQKQRKVIWARAVVTFLFVPLFLGCIICIFAFTFNKQTLFLNKLSTNDIVLEGELVFRKEDGMTSYYIIEIHEGSNYCIQYPEVTYIKRDGQFYIDRGNGPELITDSMATESEVVEMFGRCSMLGGYDFPSLKLESKYPTTILALLDGTEINCVCEEYIPHTLENVDNTDAVLKIYYVKKEPYAIQAREDNRFMYYITSWK